MHSSPRMRAERYDEMEEAYQRAEHSTARQIPHHTTAVQTAVAHGVTNRLKDMKMINKMDGYTRLHRDPQRSSLQPPQPTRPYIRLLSCAYDRSYRLVGPV